MRECRECGDTFANHEGHALCLACADTAWTLFTEYGIPIR